MAKTSTRQWKGCMMCKPHKIAAMPMAERKPFRDLRALGKKRKVTRHDCGDAE